MLGDVDRGAAILAAEGETLDQSQRDQNHRCGDAPGRVARQQADEESADAHQGHGDQEGVFASDHVAETAEDQRAERADRETRSESKQREDEADIGRHVGKEVFGQKRSERSVDVEIVPLENGTE